MSTYDPYGRMSRCRGCGASGVKLTFAADEHIWVQDEDDYGYPHCDTCIAEYLAMPWVQALLLRDNTSDSAWAESHVQGASELSTITDEE